MTRTRTAAVLIATLLAATACSGDADPDPAPGPASDVANTEPAAPTSETSAPPPGDPVEFYSSGRSCAEFTGPTVIWEEIRVKRPLTLRDLTPVALEGGFEPGTVSVVEVPQGERSVTGSVKGREVPADMREQVGWDLRVPAAGAEVGKGNYYVFLEARVLGAGSYDGMELSWTDESGLEGASLWDVQDEYRKKCRL